VLWYRSFDGVWLTTPQAVQPMAGSGAQHLDLPSRVQGNWRIEARLLDGTGAVSATASRSLLVADAPTARLRLSRLVANSADRVLAKATLSAGPVPVAVRLMAWLVAPDGSTRGLPGLAPDQLEVYRGPSQNASFTLLDRAFDDTEQGSYRVHLGLYDGNGRVLGLDSARLQICDTPAQVTGVVRDAAGAPVDGTAATSATVSVFDLDDRATAARAPIPATGTFEFTLLPGRYKLAPSVGDATGWRQGLSATFNVGCDGTAVTQDVALGNP
jgi:hypothetical protein